MESMYLYKQPILKVLPSIAILQEYAKSYSSICKNLQSLSQQKTQDFQHIGQQVEEFVATAQSYGTRIQDNCQKLKNKSQQIFSSTVSLSELSEQQENQEQSNCHSMFKTKAKREEKDLSNQKIVRQYQTKQTKNISKGHHVNVKKYQESLRMEAEREKLKKYKAIQGKQREELQKLILKKRRQKNFELQNQAKKKMRRNPNVSQLYLINYILNHVLSETDRRYYFKRQIVTYQICSACEQWVPSSSHYHMLKEHFHRKHNREVPKHNLISFTGFQLFQMQKQKIDRGELAIYKCNCLIETLPNKQSYISHMRQVHEGNVPPYSSHVFVTKQQAEGNKEEDEIEVNQQYDQYKILQEIIIGDIFYCGSCRISFKWCAQLYYNHIIDFHQGVVDHPGSSHFLKEEAVQALKNQAIKQKANKPHRKQLQNNPYSQLCLRSKANQHASRRMINQPKPIQIPVGQKVVHGFHRDFAGTSPSFQQEDFFKMIVLKHQGPFCCSHCNKNFKNYQQIIDHFNGKDGKNPYPGAFFETNFIRVKIFKLKQKCYQIYYLPLSLNIDDKINEQLQNTVLNVPISKLRTRKIEGYIKMTYKMFVNYVQTSKAKISNNTNSTFSWTRE